MNKKDSNSPNHSQGRKNEGSNPKKGNGETKGQVPRMRNPPPPPPKKN